jgi:glycosyltransferase involved in cell wall biosynthesis
VGARAAEGASTPERVRILRVIARLNMGGPAHHVGILGSRLDPDRYETLLLHGEVGAGEASLDELVRSRGAAMEPVPGLRPELQPRDDMRALAHLVRAVRRVRPHIVHTHTAKAGMLGRLATVLAGGPRPIVVHTYHGHVLEGYFGPVRNGVYRGLERRLAGVSDRLIGVSSATVEDLVRLRIAERSKFQVIPIGLDLDGFLEPPAGAREAFRREAGVADGEILVSYVGRLAAIKRIDVMLRAFARARELGAPVRLALVGDGDLRPGLERLATQLGISDRVWFAGYREDVGPVAAGADIALLTSDNEGTPVSLIEAAAAGNPAVATAVGGVADVVTPDTGILAPAGEEAGLGAALAELAADADRRYGMGERARRHVRDRFSAERLARDIDRLYLELVGTRRAAPAPSPPALDKKAFTS